MAVGDALTADYQLEFFGGNDEIETVVIGNGENGVEIVELDLWSGAAMRTSDINRPLDDGQFAGEDFYSGRSINVAFEIWANTEAEIYDRWFEMSRIWRLRRNPKTMAVRLPDWPSDLFVDVGQRLVAVDVVSQNDPGHDAAQSQHVDDLPAIHSLRRRTPPAIVDAC